ncbi:MAG: peptidoglycan DD-metalloendopeptidase family protein [Rikenellaceae bacterium]
MNRCIKILLLGVFLTSSFSCSRFFMGRNKNVYTSVSHDSTNVAKDNRVILKPSDNADKNDKSWTEIAEKADTSDIIDQIDSDNVYKKIDENFSSRELQHATISNYNPFDENGQMYFNLRNMTREFHYPVSGHLLSNFGRRGSRNHSGVDLKAEKGENVYAAFDGVVRMSSYYGGYGNIVVIRHNNGLETFYGHNTKLLVKVGDKVSYGDVIAYAGRTGRATGNHVHFEVRVQGQVINPNLLINTTTKTLQDKDLYIYNRSGKVYASNNDTSKRVEPTTEQTPAKEVAKNDIEKPTPDVKSSSTDSKVAVHIIKKGDTLYKLSKKYGTSIAKLCEINNIKEKATLSLGQKIKLK